MKSLKLSTDHGDYSISFYKHVSMDFAESFISKNMVVYIFKKGSQLKQYEQIKTVLPLLKFPLEKMETAVRINIPSIVENGDITLEDGSKCLMLLKPENTIPLNIVLDTYGKLPWQHVAWIVNRLIQLDSCLNVIGVAHNGFDTRSVYLLPSSHEVYIPNWCYAQAVKPLQNDTHTTDLKLIAKLAQDICSDEFPDPMKEFFAKLPPQAVQAYVDFNTMLSKIGPRKFVDLPIPVEDILDR